MRRSRRAVLVEHVTLRQTEVAARRRDVEHEHTVGRERGVHPARHRGERLEAGAGVGRVLQDLPRRGDGHRRRDLGVERGPDAERRVRYRRAREVDHRG